MGHYIFSSDLQPKFIKLKIDHMVSHVVGQALHRLCQNY